MKPWPDVPYPAIKFVLTAGDGELFWMPNFDRFRGPSMGLLLEARPGKALDCMDGVTSGRELVSRIKALAHRLSPWADDVLEDAEVTDEDSWLTGTFSNMLLETPPPHVQQVLGAASQVPAIADAFIDDFGDPRNFWPWIADPVEAQAFIQRMSPPRQSA